MSNTVTHEFVSAVADSGDTTLVRPSNWNHEHIFAGGALGQYLTYDAATSDNVTWKYGATPFNVKNYGALGNGATDDRLAIQACFDAACAVGQNKTIFFPTGTYYVGDFALNTNIINLSALGNGIRILTEGKVTLKCNTTFVTAMPRFFYMENNSDFYCDPIFFDDGAFTTTALSMGGIGFYLHNDGTMNWGNCTFESITCHGMGTGFMISALSGTPSYTNRIRGITINHLFCNECYYGFHTQNDGDDIVINNLHTWRNIRSFYVYGSRGIKVGLLYCRYPHSSTGQVMIARQVDGLNTEGINVNLVVRDATEALLGYEAYVHLQHIDLLGGTIRDITVNVDIEDNVTPVFDAIRISNAAGSGLAETTAASLNYTADVRLSGSVNGAGVKRISCVASFLAKRQMHFIPGLNFLPSTELLQNFQFTQLSRDTTDCLWVSTSDPQPVLGDGILEYDLDIINGIAHVTVSLTIGSTTTMGTNQWGFLHFGGASTYITSTANAIGSFLATDLGTRFYTGITKINATASGFYCYVNDSASAVGAITPFTWATGDTLVATIQFPISG